MTYSSDWKQKISENKTVIGIYDSIFSTKAAVDKLKDQGFKGSDISVITPKNFEELDSKIHKFSKTKSTIISGALTCAVLGGTAGWLIGMGAFSWNDKGPFLTSSPITSSIIGIVTGAVVGAIAGIILGVLLGIGMEVKKDRPELRKNGIQLMVHCNDSDWINRAKKLLEVTGAHEIASITES
ncbi:MAG: quinol:electron acceptor oxidoreductase subunit ActD [Bacteriovorax sp.]